MILIADSGSTKTDWVLLDTDKTEVLRTSTIGFNPYFCDSKLVEKEILDNQELYHYKDKISRVFFYGAGCSSKLSNQIIEKGMTMVFKKAKILVDHDMLAAAYAGYDGSPSIVCILGTGSNCCYFDGKNIRSDMPSLGYIFGDKGSGNHLGKKVLTQYFEKKMPKDLSEKLEDSFDVRWDTVKNNIYNKPLPNTYLATFSEFVYQYKEHPFIKKLVEDAFVSFFVSQVEIYPESKTCPIHFSGSVAYYFQDILAEVMQKLNYKMGNIIKKPIDSLVKYHVDYLL
ncbi:MAG: ATPase [Flavobacteriaceae bacterium]|nr:MAG: ATPase [Flavobacteriaceae bacterium]